MIELASFARDPKQLARLAAIIGLRKIGLHPARDSKSYYDAKAGKVGPDAIIPFVIDGQQQDRKYSEYAHSQIAEFWSHMEPAATILEVGCGELRNLAVLREINPELQLTGIDISAARIEAGKKNHDTTGMDLQTADACNLPFDDDAFDVVYTVHCLEQMPRTFKAAVKEMQRVAKRVFLFEPSFTLGSLEQKRRMIEMDYVTRLESYCQSEGFTGPTKVKHSGMILNQCAMLSFAGPDAQ